MVLLCKGLPQEVLDFNGVTFNNAVNNNPAQIDASSNDQMMNTFLLIIHGYSYVNEVKWFVKKINGVERVKGEYCNASKLEVTGKVDPFKIQEMVECETRKKVELIFLSSQIRGDRDKNQGTEEKLKKGKKMMHKNTIANKKTEESLSVLKIQLCCGSCNEKLRKNLKRKGLETITMDVEKSLVTVKGAVDLIELRSYFKDELKKDVEVIVPTQVDIPATRQNSSTCKKEVNIGIMTKKAREDKFTNKKDMGSSAAFVMKYRGDGKEDKNKVDLINGEKNTRGIKDTKPKISSVDGAGNERSQGEGSSSNFCGTGNVNPEIYYRSNNNMNDDFSAFRPVQDLDDSYQIFNDENPHSCHIM